MKKWINEYRGVLFYYHDFWYIFWENIPPVNKEKSFDLTDLFLLRAFYYEKNLQINLYVLLHFSIDVFNTRCWIFYCGRGKF